MQSGVWFRDDDKDALPIPPGAYAATSSHPRYLTVREVHTKILI